MPRVKKNAKDEQRNQDERLHAALDAARAALESNGFIATSKLGPTKLRAEVAKRLCEQGFEKTPKGLRTPLAQQTEALVASGQHTPLGRFASLLRGASAKEATQQRAALLREGRMALVLRGKQLTLVPNSERAVSRRSLKPLAEALKAAASWLAKANADKTGATVLHADIAEILAEVTRLLAVPEADSHELKERAVDASTGAPSTPATNGVAMEAAVRGAILALRDEDTALASVPAVSKKLRARATSADVIQALLDGFKRGQLELRPEGGIGRLSTEEVALCPKGAGGVPLSWVLLLEGES